MLFVSQIFHNAARASRILATPRVGVFVPGGPLPSYWRSIRLSLYVKIAALCLSCIGTSSAADGLLVQVDITDQTMVVIRDGGAIFRWPVSTGAAEYRTPTGSFRPTRMHETWYSIRYDGIPMPNSIFFFHGYAIHGTLDTRDLGRPASRGCIRLHPKNAKALFDLVAEQGMSRTRIIIQE